MWKNYLLIASRTLWKNKVFSLINILGLSVGLACCILMFLFIQHEQSYDRFHVQAKDIYRITSAMDGSNGSTHLAVTPAPWAPLMKKDYPEIKSYTRLLKDEKALIGPPGEQQFFENNLLYADSTLFDVFTISLEKGEVKRALERPNSIILTSETAKKYFGHTNPIGKTLSINSFGRNLTVEVTALARPMPANSHFAFSSLVSLATLGDLSGLWSFHMFQSYVVLNSNTAANSLENKFPAFVKRYILNNPSADGKQDIHLQPLTDIHLRSNLVGEIGTNGNITYVYAFACVALFVLLLACFNFTNLSTARSLTRAKEVGLRKVVGAEKRQLLQQFLTETTLFALLALIIAIAMAYLALPLFNRVAERSLTIDFVHNPLLTFVLIGLVLVVGILAGLYPAVILSAFKPTEVLKGKFSNSRKGLSLRLFLVTLQFVVSMGLIAGTFLVNHQLNFLKSKNLGFDRENVVILTLPKDMELWTTKYDVWLYVYCDSQTSGLDLLNGFPSFWRSRLFF
ncbi:hypothetical protein AHMF7605_11550 [Adhaeribacter arboris]|uniref:Cell division protein FtsX n=1 Tax=Adhaeribacter arboris TaxID=2072846 RepID=A0A2T2YF11_9BACT|nr:ABC transporter permease [Adhaeribacter arboris]PSR54106.1 hypothetical protein AHMF7605_11550 [Adhaeribacter arboris]